jgi:hypothetical protein
MHGKALHLPAASATVMDGTLPGKSTFHTRFRHRARSSRYMLEKDLHLPLALERCSVRSRLAESVFILNIMLQQQVVTRRAALGSSKAACSAHRSPTVVARRRKHVGKVQAFETLATPQVIQGCQDRPRHTATNQPARHSAAAKHRQLVQ